MTVTTPTASPHPTESEQAAADLATALVDWQGDGTGQHDGQHDGPLREAAQRYAEDVCDFYTFVPELRATADRVIHACVMGDTITVVADHARDLLDIVETWTQDRLVQDAARAHDAWRGEAPAPF